MCNQLLIVLATLSKLAHHWCLEAVFTLNKLSISLVAPPPQCSPTYHCLTVMVLFLGASVGSLARGHVGLESPLCDKGYCTKLLAGCMGGSHTHTYTHTFHESNQEQGLFDTRYYAAVDCSVIDLLTNLFDSG